MKCPLCGAKCKHIKYPEPLNVAGVYIKGHYECTNDECAIKFSDD